MVLGHECVFCRGGPEQRAVHKGCGMERRTAGQAGSRREPRQTAGKTASEAAPACSLCLENESRMNLQHVCSHKSINEAVKSCQETS